MLLEWEMLAYNTSCRRDHQACALDSTRHPQVGGTDPEHTTIHYVIIINNNNILRYVHKHYKLEGV